MMRLLNTEQDQRAASFHLSHESEWRQQPAALTQLFRTPRAAVFYILDLWKPSFYEQVGNMPLRRNI